MHVDWAPTASLATAGGTLVLAMAAFASVRSANRAARAAEQSLLAGLFDEFHPQNRDIYLPPGEVGFWQGAFRDQIDPQYDPAGAAAHDRARH